MSFDPSFKETKFLGLFLLFYIIISILEKRDGRLFYESFIVLTHSLINQLKGRGLFVPSSLLKYGIHSSSSSMFFFVFYDNLDLSRGLECRGKGGRGVSVREMSFLPVNYLWPTESGYERSKFSLSNFLTHLLRPF